jgi:perosamine synthetase
MEYIHQMEPWIDESEIMAVNDYLKSGAWLTEFNKTTELENMLCEFTGSRFSTMVTNGTVSITVGLMALGIGFGDEVIVPDYTMIASANAVRLCGAIPVFADIEASSLCLDLKTFKSAITDKTKALILVSLNGRYPEKLNEIIDTCKDENIAVLEDAAQSLGSFIGDKHLGTLGQIGSFSFSSQKIITTGQGGALITDSEDLHSKIRGIKDFGRKQGGVDYHEMMGFNFKFTDLQAVVGIEQMKKLPDRIRRKKEIYSNYDQALQNVEQIDFIATNLEETSPWFIDILVPDPAALQSFLKKSQIGSRFFYPPVHSQPVYNSGGTFPVAEHVSKHGLWLPSSLKLSDSELEHICSTIKMCYT